jgi:hypothetical protein
MRKSKNERVQKFLDETEEFDVEKFDILLKLRKIVFVTYPNVNERVMYGGIMFSLEDDFGGLFVRKNHISFEFVNGYEMKDPTGMLEGTGQFRRHLKIKSLDDIKKKKVEGFVRQAG